MRTVLDLIQTETNYVFRRATSGGEYAGPCPFCREGVDRFRVWPEKGNYWCRRCGKSGDSIQFLRDYSCMTFYAAADFLGKVNTADSVDRLDSVDRPDKRYQNPPFVTPPDSTWEKTGCDFVYKCGDHLMVNSEGGKAVAWLHSRMLHDSVINRRQLGLNPEDRWDARSRWGLPPSSDAKSKHKGLWLPKGIVIPYVCDSMLWGIRIRRPVDEPKYYWVPGGTLILYNADTLRWNHPVVLLEGELDALTVEQVAGDVVAAVATGSTQGARQPKWLSRLALASIVLVAFDADEAGDKASHYWLDNLRNARRWRPFWGDANDMARDGVDLRSWILAGLAQPA